MGEFVALSAIVRGEARAASDATSEPPTPVLAATPVSTPPATSAERSSLSVPREFALARFAALDAFERACARLLERLAAEVLARELALAPVDLGALVARATASLADEGPLAFAVEPAAVAAFEGIFDVRADPALGPGDLVCYVGDLAFESRTAFRLRGALDAAFVPLSM